MPHALALDIYGRVRLMQFIYQAFRHLDCIQMALNSWLVAILRIQYRLPVGVPGSLLTLGAQPGLADYGFNHRAGAAFSSTDPSLQGGIYGCLLYTSPSPRDRTRSRMPSSA